MENFRIEKTNVTQQIIAYIRHNIESGTWPAGSRIDSEVELAERLGVSRTPIREALRRLSNREQQIISLRFFQGRTQMEVASEIGISQAQVSRLEKAALSHMRKLI